MEVQDAIKEYKTDSKENANVLLPEQIISSINLTKPQEQVVVKGIVTRITPHLPSKWVYGDLAGNESTITYRCPISNAPKTEGERIIIRGYIRVRPSKIHDGLQIEIDGVPVGTWQSYDAEKNYQITERQHTRINLDDFIQRHGLNKLLIVATSIGESDYKKPLASNGFENISECVRGNFLNIDKLLDTISNAIQKHEPAGLVFVRGGSDSEKTMRIWNDAELIVKILQYKIPIFSALGHSNKLLLVDKYADESFTTPTDFGHCLMKIVTEQENKQAIEDENARLNQQCRSLNKELDQQRTEIDKHTQATNKIKLFYRKWIVTIILVIVIAGVSLYVALEAGFIKLLLNST